MDLALELAGLKEIPTTRALSWQGKTSKVAFGVDMEAAEMLIARELGVDLVITHPPPWSGLRASNLHKVMENQIERMAAAGVPVNKAQKALREQMGKVERSLHVSNYDRAASAARLLKMPFMGIHSPADVISERTVQQHPGQQSQSQVHPATSSRRCKIPDTARTDQAGNPGGQKRTTPARYL